MLNALYQRASPIARRMLPQGVRARLGQFIGRIEHMLAPLAELRTAPSLSSAAPLLSRDAFRGGPILHINNALAWGGVERQIVNTLLGLQQQRGHALGLLCLRLEEGGDYAFYRDALGAFDGEIRDMRSLAWANTHLRSAFSQQRLDKFAPFFDFMPADVRERIWRLLAEFVSLKPAAVHAWQDGLSIETAYAAKFVGVPIIVTSARNMAPTNFAYGRPYMRPAYRAISECRDIAMLANSEAGARDYASWLDIDLSRFKIIRNGVNTTDVQPLDHASIAERRRALGVPDGAPIVGSVFRFYDEKRPMLWMQTAALVAERRPDTHFVVFGAGPLKEDARAHAERHGFGRRFHAPGAAIDGANVISIFDVFLLTSKFEGTPNVVLEASSLGVPVVATPGGGTAEAIAQGETGFVETDTRELAGRVVTLLTDSVLRQRCAVAGPRFVGERFGLARMLDETLALYEPKDTACSNSNI